MIWVPLGKLTRTHGLKGELKFYPSISNLDICRGFRRFFLSKGDCGEKKEYAVESLRGSNVPLIVKIKGCNSFEGAQALCGSTIFVLKEEFKKPPEGEYYWFEIEGLNVFDEAGRFYGCVTEIIETGSNDVYVVRDGKCELLLPAIEMVIKSIDLKQQKLVFHIVEGLLEGTSV